MNPSNTPAAEKTASLSDIKALVVRTGVKAGVNRSADGSKEQVVAAP